MESIIYQNQAVYEIEKGDARVLIAPQFGARLLTWEIAEEPIIHWPEDADWSNVAHVRGGNPILFPFIARHMVNGVIGKWRDEQGVVRDLPMHGFARDMAFEMIEEADPYTIRMRLESDEQTRAMYPFDWRFDVVYRLLPDALETMLETTNTGKVTMPYYPGHHYYFAVPHDERNAWSLDLPCKRWGWQNPDGSYHFAAATSSKFTLDNPDIIDRCHLDFTQPQVVLAHGDERRITIELLERDVPWFDVTTWTLSPESDFFCVEPWLGLPNAIHHHEGLRHLESGATERATCRIVVR